MHILFIYKRHPRADFLYTPTTNRPWPVILAGAPAINCTIECQAFKNSAGYPTVNHHSLSFEGGYFTHEIDYDNVTISGGPGGWDPTNYANDTERDAAWDVLKDTTIAFSVPHIGVTQMKACSTIEGTYFTWAHWDPPGWGPNSVDFNCLGANTRPAQTVAARRPEVWRTVGMRGTGVHCICSFDACNFRS